jgi:hypothetical protein
MEHVHFDTLGFVRSSGRNGRNGYNDINPCCGKRGGAEHRLYQLSS